MRLRSAQKHDKELHERYVQSQLQRIEQESREMLEQERKLAHRRRMAKIGSMSTAATVAAGALKWSNAAKDSTNTKGETKAFNVVAAVVAAVKASAPQGYSTPLSPTLGRSTSPNGRPAPEQTWHLVRPQPAPGVSTKAAAQAAAAKAGTSVATSHTQKSKQKKAHWIQKKHYPTSAKE